MVRHIQHDQIQNNRRHASGANLERKFDGADGVFDFGTALAFLKQASDFPEFEMDGIEGPRTKTAAEDKRAVFADVLCQVDGFGSRSQAFPPNLPELESGLWANQNFIEIEEHLRKVADGL